MEPMMYGHKYRVVFWHGHDVLDTILQYLDTCAWLYAYIFKNICRSNLYMGYYSHMKASRIEK